MGQMFFGAEFPSKSGDFHVVTEKFLAHCGGIHLGFRKHFLHSALNVIDVPRYFYVSPFQAATISGKYRPISAAIR